MRRLGGLIAVTLFASALCGAESQAAEPCFWLHGRLFAANGNPTFRIWPIGTKRILGVSTGEAIGDLPAPVQPLFSSDAFDVDVYGDYQVCPLAPDRRGWMRFVRLVQARRLVARPAAGWHSSQ